VFFYSGFPVKLKIPLVHEDEREKPSAVPPLFAGGKNRRSRHPDGPIHKSIKASL